MESSDIRRQSDVLPSINYSEFERQAREGAQFHQRHPSIAHNNISAASPISPTTTFGVSGPHPLHSPSAHNGIHTPPDSRRTSDNNGNEPRQSLPSLSEALLEKRVSFSAPSPMQTPPIGSGPFSGPSRTNSMPRSQPAEAGPGSQPLPPAPAHPPHGYGSTSQVSSHEPPYTRHDSQSSGRTLPPNPYSQSQPPSGIPAMHPPETYPPPPVPTHPQSSSPPYQSHSQYPPTSNQASPPHYPSHTPQFTNAPPLSSGPPSQYPPYPPQQAPPPPTAATHNPYPSHGPSQPQPPYPYNQAREAVYPPQSHHEPPGPPGGPSPAPKGMKRGSGYGIAIEQALSISSIRREMDSAKENASRIYHIIHNYQESSQGGRYPSGVNTTIQSFTEALQRSQNNTEALQTCLQVFRDLSAKEYAEQNAQKVAQVHGSEYGTDESQSYDDNRSNGSQQPEQKKMRRGRAAPPGRCHSCHRAETPEWRRGPDGARTLCNACGLHYAKLTRKLSKNSIGSGPLANRKPSNSPHPS